MKKHLFTALLAVIVTATFVYAATWSGQGYTEDSDADGTEKVFTENGAGTANNFMTLATIKTWLDGEAWTFTGDVDMSGASSFTTGPLTFEGTTVDTNQTSFSITDPTADRTISVGDYDTRIPAASAVNADGTIILADEADGLSATGQAATETLTNKDLSAASNTFPSSLAVVIDSGTAALGTAEIADGACATTVTETSTGVATTDVIQWSFASDPTGVTGYSPSGNLVYIVDYPSANAVNFDVCNKSGSPITPGAVTLNWRVDR